MASGRKNRGSRHRSHRHKQQKLDDTGGGGGGGEVAAESDTDQNLRHGPNPSPSPNPNPNPNPKNLNAYPNPKNAGSKNPEPKNPNPWAMEPLPPNVEGPSVLKQLDKTENNVDRNNYYYYDSSKVSQSKRRKDNVVTTLEMDRWEGGNSDGTIAMAAPSNNSLAMEGDGLLFSYDKKDSKDEGDWKGKGKGKEREEETGDFLQSSKSMEIQDLSFQESKIHVTSKVISAARRESSKDIDLDVDGSMSMGLIDLERKRKKNDVSHKPKRSEDEEEYYHALEKGMYRNLDEKHKDDSSKTDNGRGSWSKDREEKRKFDKSRDDRSSEGKRDIVNDSKDDFSDVRHKEGMHGDIKDKDNRMSENRHKENRTKEGRYKDEKEKELKLKIQGDICDEEKLKSDTGSKKEYPNRHKEDKGTTMSNQDDKVKRGREQLVKEDRSKLKERTKTDVEDEDKERTEKYKDDGSAIVKNKHEKKKGDTEQSSSGKNREDSRTDHVVEFKGKYDKKYSEREQDYSSRPVKAHTDKGRIEKQLDNRDMDDREKHERQRASRERNGRHIETPSKDGKFHNANEKDSKFNNVNEKDSKFHNANEKDGKYRDDRGTSEREKSKDDGDRHSKYKDESKERRWGSSPQEERSKDGKESLDLQKHIREIDDRRRYDINDGKHRTDRGKSDKRYSDRTKEERAEDSLASDRLGGINEAIKETGVGGKSHMKELDGQPELRGSYETEARDSKGHPTARGDRSALKSSRSTSQDQDRILSGTSAKDTNTSENRSRRNRDSDALDAAVAERENSRGRGRPAEDPSDSQHEKPARRSKFEMSMSVSSSGGGTRRPRERNWHVVDHMDQGKQYIAFDEEVRSWESRSANQDSDDERRRPISHDRTRDSRLSLSPRGGQDSTLSKDANALKRKPNKFSQGAVSIKARRVDEMSNERHERGTQMNRIQTDGPLGRQMPHSRPSASLPPPPPYRPGVDNPAVVSAQSNYGEDKPRESGRYDRKGGGTHVTRPDMMGPGDAWGNFGMGNWNAHNQGPVPGPGNMFASFPQMGSGGFLGMGQQFHVPQMFGPRPSADVGFGGARFHMGDGGSAFPGHGPNHGSMMGWHRFPDGNESHRPLSGFMDASWEGPGRYLDDRQRFGHPEWDQFSQGLSRGGWEGAPEPWPVQGQSHAVDGKFDSNLHHSNREGVYPSASKDEDPHLDMDAEKIQLVNDQAQELSVASPVHSTEPPRKADSKGSKRSQARLQKILLHANVCSELVDADLYNEYLKLIPPSEATKKEAHNKMDVSAIFLDEDLEFEVDPELQKLLSTPDPLATIMPSISDNLHKDVLKLYTRHNHIQKSVVGSFILPEHIGPENIQG